MTAISSGYTVSGKFKAITCWFILPSTFPDTSFNFKKGMHFSSFGHISVLCELNTLYVESRGNEHSVRS